MANFAVEIVEVCGKSVDNQLQTAIQSSSGSGMFTDIFGKEIKALKAARGLTSDCIQNSQNKTAHTI